MIYIVEQHNIGLGHLTRSKLIAQSLGALRPVTLFTGGELPVNSVWPRGLRIVPLEPLRRHPMVPGLNVPVDPNAKCEHVQRQRRERLLYELEQAPPELFITEFFPFASARMLDLLDAVLTRIRQRWPYCQILSSIRDVPVSDWEVPKSTSVLRHLSESYDLVLSHADPAFLSVDDLPVYAGISERFQVVHTGIMVDQREGQPNGDSAESLVVVSCGGGRFTYPLLQTLIPSVAAALPSDFKIVVVLGPFFDADSRTLVKQSAERFPAVTVVDEVSSLAQLLAKARLFVGRAGYNSTAECLAARLPMVLVPRPNSLEQQLRARALSRAGWAVTVEEPFEPRAVRDAVRTGLERGPGPSQINLSGQAGALAAVRRLL